MKQSLAWSLIRSPGASVVDKRRGSRSKGGAATRRTAARVARLSGRGSATGTGTAAALLLASFRDLANTDCVDLGRDPLERDVRTIRAFQDSRRRPRGTTATTDAGLADGICDR